MLMMRGFFGTRCYTERKPDADDVQVFAGPGLHRGELMLMMCRFLRDQDCTEAS